MICELLIIGSVAINPCRVIEMTPSKSSQVVGRNWIGFSKWDFIPDGGCWVQLSTEGRARSHYPSARRELRRFSSRS